MKRIKKNDTVVVITGREKGKTGKVLRVVGDRVTIEKLNLVKRHTRPTEKHRQGGIVEKEAPMHLSNVQLVSPSTGKPVRVGYKLVEDGAGKSRKVRFARQTGEVLD